MVVAWVYIPGLISIGCWYLHSHQLILIGGFLWTLLYLSFLFQKDRLFLEGSRRNNILKKKRKLLKCKNYVMIASLILLSGIKLAPICPLDILNSHRFCTHTSKSVLYHDCFWSKHAKVAETGKNYNKKREKTKVQYIVVF